MWHFLAGFFEVLSVSFYNGNYFVYGICYVGIYLSLTSKDNLVWWKKGLLYNMGFFIFGASGLIESFPIYEYSRWWSIAPLFLISTNTYILYFLYNKKINIIWKTSIITLLHYFTIEYIPAPLSLSLSYYENMISLAEYIGMIGYTFVIYLLIFNFKNNYKSIYIFVTLFFGVAYFHKVDYSKDLIKKVKIYHKNENSYVMSQEQFDKRLKNVSSNEGLLTIYPENYLPLDKQSMIADGNLVGLFWERGSKVYLYNQYYEKKKHLLFGEYFPFWDKSFEKVNYNKILQYDDYKIAAPLCFEMSYPVVLDEMSHQNFNLIINLANEFLVMDNDVKRGVDIHAKWRAVENKKSVLRINNGGRSLHIEPDGSVSKQYEMDQEATEILEVVLNNERTVYSYIQYYPYLLIFIIFSIVYVFRKINKYLLY